MLAARGLAQATSASLYSSSTNPLIATLAMDYRGPFQPNTFSISPASNTNSSPHHNIGQSPYGRGFPTNLLQAQEYIEPPPAPLAPPSLSAEATAKRGSKACVACRRGKNRCEPSPDGRSASCRRCLINNTPCVFEKPAERPPKRNDSVAAESDQEWVHHRTVNELARGQQQIQNALSQLLSVIPLQHDGAVPTASILSPPKEFPKLPGFKAPNHQWGTYGVIPLPSAPGSPASSASSPLLNAPIQALEALANAANKASDDPEDRRKRKRVKIEDLRVKRPTKPDPTPRNPFPDVITKGLVSQQEARALWDIFFSGCHLFVPLWDRSYDTFESFVERTPFSTNGLLAIAAKIRAGNGPLDAAFHHCLEEAQGIARSTLLGPIVRKEAALAMLILSAWSQNAWLPSGHALRMGLDMNLHRALDKLATKADRSEIEERDLVVSARIWLNCYLQDHLVSLGTGKPLLLRDDSSSRGARILLSHHMQSETDIRLVASVELVNIRVRVYEHLTPLHGRVDTQTLSFVRRTFVDLQDWYREWTNIHRQNHSEDSVLVKLLEAELVHAQLWTICVALRGVQWDKLPADQRELAFQAKDAALRCLEIYLQSVNFRAHLKYATHDQLVSVAFAAVFLLKIALVYPQSLSLPDLISQVGQVAQMLSNECYAERYALTLRLMLASLRRKTGTLSTVPGTPRQMTLMPEAQFDVEGLDSLLSMPQAFDSLGADLNFQDMNFSWPTEFSPSNLPVWLQDGNSADLGLPMDGSDSLFLPAELANMFLPSATQFGLPDTGDVGAQAW